MRGLKNEKNYIVGIHNSQRIIWLEDNMMRAQYDKKIT